MYCEISPRQSGKTTRLIQAALDYLIHNPTHIIAVVGISGKTIKHLKHKLVSLVNLLDITTPSMLVMVNRVRFKIPWAWSGVGYDREPDYWFFDEFGYMEERGIRHPITRDIIDNAYYSTTPGFTNSTNIIVEYCNRHNTQIHFNNPWAEERIQEQNNWSNYTREAVLGDWTRYMEERGLIKGIKINLIRKEIKKHRFTLW